MSPLLLTLVPMLLLQATVALGLFSLATLAPALQISVPELGWLNMFLFGVGALIAFQAGRLLRWLGPWPVAILCAVSVALGMACLALWGRPAIWFAAFFFGLAFGPETPASTALLAAVTPAARRPLVFSVRQTGNQIGAIGGSLTLPLLLALDARLPFILVAVISLSLALWCAWLARKPGLRHVAIHASSVPKRPKLPLQKRAWALGTMPLRWLALAAFLFSATQMSLNVFLLSHAVWTWGMALPQAAAWVALLQLGGLIGRLAWGWLAQHFASASRLLGAIGLLAASTGLLLMLSPLSLGGWVFGTLLLVLGFAASGWNGVLVAEVTRLAGSHQAGELTGRVLGYGYLGLAFAPGAFAWAAGLTDTRIGFVCLFLATGLAACGLIAAQPGRTVN
ncbi:MFS transporter [Rhodoferax sp.]|uniref:MFS transporter n=1 Tax=Rhodoferax sp. TaxID=50421 RepID=UPI0025CFC9B7|nr:MFS transporter [Rhodoferax sp.]MCM2339887.1 MFS transporter [Rhodoferax sp.]